jgi:hypothetical protein
VTFCQRLRHDDNNSKTLYEGLTFCLDNSFEFVCTHQQQTIPPTTQPSKSLTLFYIAFLYSKMPPTSIITKVVVMLTKLTSRYCRSSVASSCKQSIQVWANGFDFPSLILVGCALLAALERECVCGRDIQQCSGGK